MYPRISRHYQQVHSNEAEVAKILMLAKKSKERKALWANLVNKGNYHHNCQGLQKKHGAIIPKYKEKEHLQYVPCEFLVETSKDLQW